MSEQREALEETISQGIGWAEYAWVPQDTGNYNTSRLMFIKSLGKQATDNAIAHLWSRADDPEVVEAVAQEQSTRSGYLGPMTSTMRPLAVDKFRADARYDIQRILTALLGPRPSGEEAE